MKSGNAPFRACAWDIKDLGASQRYVYYAHSFGQSGAHPALMLRTEPLASRPCGCRSGLEDEGDNDGEA